MERNMCVFLENLRGQKAGIYRGLSGLKEWFRKETPSKLIPQR